MYLHVFIKSAVYVMQKPICLVHLVAMHEVTSRMGKIAAIWQKIQRENSAWNEENGCWIQLVLLLSIVRYKPPDT